MLNRRNYLQDLCFWYNVDLKVVEVQLVVVEAQAVAVLSYSFRMEQVEGLKKEEAEEEEQLGEVEEDSLTSIQKPLVDVEAYSELN